MAKKEIGLPELTFSVVLTFTVFGFVGWFGLRISVFVFLVGG
jgi:hypothetical protein